MAATNGLFILLSLLVLVQVQVGFGRGTGGRIINGNTATRVYQYHAHLNMLRAGDVTRVGSGVVLTRRLIITVAQNVFGFDSYRAGFGDIERGQLVWRDALVGDVISGYVPETLEHNVGFLVFAPNALVIDNVTPIAIPDVIFGDDLPLTNEQGRVVGFGHTSNGDDFADDLQVAFKRVIDHDICRESYPRHEMEHTFCAVDFLQHGKICGGDQGGAFVTQINGVEHLTGLSAYVLGTDCVREQPALFVRVLHYRDYIRSMSSVFN